MSSSVTIQQVSDLVLANRVIRAPYYEKDHDEGVQFTDPDRGLQWGADAIPALLDLFRVEEDPRDTHPSGWVGFARHWRGDTVRLDFELYETDVADPVVVVTAMSGIRGETTIEDEVFGAVELPDQVPSEDEWTDRHKRYEAARRNDDTDTSAAVQAFISALPGWKREVATAFDEIIQQEVPDVRRAVKWHQPFYGVPDQGWFAAFGAFSKHVKLTFIAEAYLDPRPPNATRPDGQAIDLEETDTLDEAQVAAWVRQAADSPGMG